MHRLYALFLCLVIGIGHTLAQQNRMPAPDIASYSYFADSINTTQYVFAMRNPVFVSVMMPGQISRASLGYRFDQGNFIAAQQSSKTKAITLQSDGTATLRKVKLFGAIAYQKTTEDSTRFAHQSRNNPTTPYYFGSPAKNHYERTVYHFKATAVRNYANERLITGFGIDYQVGDHYAVNDPRGAVKEYQANGNLAVGYHVNPSLLLGAALKIGYGQETVNISYKNPTYYESLDEPRYANYLINGYGEPIPVQASTKRNYNDRQQRRGFDISGQLATHSLGTIHLIAGSSRESQRYDIRNANGIEQKALYNLTKENVHLLWTKRFKFNVLQVAFNYSGTHGKDHHLTYNANNYAYSGDFITGSLKYTLRRKVAAHQLGMDITKFGEERLDGNSGNRVNFDNLKIQTSYRFDLNLPAGKTFGAKLSTSFTQNLNHTFAVGTAAESYFTREVIFHDYIFNTAARAGGTVGLSYGQRIFHKAQAVLCMDTYYARLLHNYSLSRNVTSLPGKDRFATQLSLNFYF